MNKIRLDFEVEGHKYYAVQPTQQQTAEADLIYKSMYSEAVRMGALTHQEALRIIDKRNIWTKDDEKERVKLLTSITKFGAELDKLPKEEVEKGLEIVTQIEGKRTELILINNRRNAILDNTAESYADEKRLHYYVSKCVMGADHEPVFKDVSSLIDENATELAAESVKNMIYLLANNGEDFRSNWPDYRWRKKQGLLDDKLNPVEGALNKLVEDAEKNDVTAKKPARKKTKRRRKKVTTKK